MMQARTISIHGPSIGGTVVSKNLHLQSKKRVVVRSGPINPDIRKEEAKVVDTVDVSEQDKKQVAYCRCWRSKTFPMCDGQHVKHNEEAGDNVGPLLVKKE